MTPDERSAADIGDLDLTEDGALGGRLRLRQPRRGHRFGHDAVLLAAATAAQPGERVVEFGAGVGGLSVGGGSEDEAKDMFAAPTAVHEFGGQPVEQFRV